MLVQVASGYRPNIPSEMPEEIAGIITACWAQEPSDRPSAAEVLVRLQVHSAPTLERTLSLASQSPGTKNFSSRGLHQR